MRDDIRPPKRGRSGTAPAVIPESFQTPEQASRRDQTPLAPIPDDSLVPQHAEQAGPANRIKTFFTDWKWHYGKRTTIAIALAVVLLLGTGVFTAYAYWRKPGVKSGHQVVTTAKPAPKITTVASKLTGLQVDPSINERPVTGVMIENSTDARPQSGLDDAGVVFEAIAEGGITRFLALYQDTQPDYLGPVRSARPYYVQWCMTFDCSLAHAGGSPEALQDIKTWSTKDLDQFANGGAYQRITSRYAPHNLYTSMAQLNQLETNKGFGASSYTGFTRKSDKPYTVPADNKKTADTRTPASSIDVAISAIYFNSHYDYDAASNSYKRSQYQAPHLVTRKDGSQVQLQPKVVIAMVMQYGLEADDHHSQYNVIGSGQAMVFQDGTVTQASWSKSDLKTPLSFTGSDGKPLSLNAGQTWLVAVSSASQVTYK